jgi:hypothetical protein
MSGVITSGSFAKALWPGVNKWYGDSYNEKPLVWTRIFEQDTSTKGYEEDVQVVGTGLMPVKAEGSPITYDDRKQGFVQRYTHIHYGLGFVVTEEAIEDDQYMIVAKGRAQALGRSVRVTQETIAANVLNRAFNSSYTYGDGKELIATDHPNYSGGTFSNELTTAADLSEASLEQLCIQISQATDDRGLRINIMPRSLIVPSDLQFEAHRILKSNLQNDTANNATNALKDMGMFPDGIIVNTFLTDTDAWFVRTDCPNGLKAFMRKMPMFAVDNDFDTSNAKFKASFRASWGATDPRGVFGSGGA